ncbi:MAG: [protein-PII] uridylyltransferase [Dermatophilaceae bacterium]
MRASGDVSGARLDLAGTRAFTAPGAGEVRRAAISDYTRTWLQEVWTTASGGRATPGLALAAVGSLGREEPAPLSDLDLVLLHDGRSTPTGDLVTFADRLWYPIWDAKLRLDHSVRTLAECRSVASNDLSAAVGLLDIAPVAGDTQLVAAIRSTLAHDWRSNARKRLPLLTEDVRARHARHGELSQSIEPDLKEARGGLRDMTILRALVAAWLTDRPHGPVDAAYGRLLDVRDALHVVTGRGRDRLGREDHDAVAALLGYADSDALLTMVSSSGRTIANAVEGTMRRAGQSQRARTLRVGPRRPQMTSLGYGVYEHDEEAVLSGVRTSDPLLPLRTAAVAAQAGLPLAPQTLANLAEAPDLPIPWPELARDLFTDLLAAGPGLIPVWEGLHSVGLIDRWIPEWAAVDSRPQRSPVHRHTVDRHLLECVVEAGTMVRDVARPDLLLLAALLHDIGKVDGAHDHSHEGAGRTTGILARMGVSSADAAIVTRLVREHLTLIGLATRRDLADPATVAAAWSAAGDDSETLDLLRCLTVADAKAAGPAAWTDWRASLLAALVGAMAAHPPGGAVSRADAGAGEYRLPAEIPALLASGVPHVVLQNLPGAFRVDVFDRDRLGLFADTAGLFAALGLTVRSAVLRTADGIAANEWHVETPSGDAPDLDRLVRGLDRLARGDRSPLASLHRRRTFAKPAAPDPHRQTRAFVLHDAATTATVIEVRGQDRLGLLHDLGVTFAKSGLSVHSAHIATYAGQTLDTFYLTEFGGAALTPGKVAATVAAVIDTCDEAPRG